MKILIVEDEVLFSDQLEMMIGKMGYVHIGTAQNGREAIQLFQAKQPDLALVDIKLDGSMDGIRVAEEFQKKGDFPVIFITSIRDEETFNRIKQIKPKAIILKPFDTLQLQRTIELVLDELIEKEESSNWEAGKISKDSIFIKTGNNLIRVRTDHITYIETEDGYCNIITFDDHKYIVRWSLDRLQAKLGAAKFIKTHRNYLINSNYLERIDLSENVVYVAGRSLPVSRRQLELVVEHFTKL